jgi:hypothetical protein
MARSIQRIVAAANTTYRFQFCATHKIVEGKVNAQSTQSGGSIRRYHGFFGYPSDRHRYTGFTRVGRLDDHQPGSTGVLIRGIGGSVRIDAVLLGGVAWCPERPGWETPVVVGSDLRAGTEFFAYRAITMALAPFSCPIDRRRVWRKLFCRV